MPTRDLLHERKVQSSEFALRAVRQRVADGEQLIGELSARVGELEQELEQAQADIPVLRERASTEAAARRAAEQLGYAERARRVEAEDELARLARAPVPADGAERELGAAQRRIHELETEFEIVARRAAEVEQSTAVAISSLRRQLADAEERSARAFEEALSLRTRLEEPVTAPVRSGRDEAGPVSAERLEQALARLRAQTPLTDAAALPGGWLGRVFRR